MKKMYDALWQKIENVKLQPIPRWVFLLQRFGVWVALVLSVVLGAFALSYMVFAVQEGDFLTVAGNDPFAILTTLLPVWVLVFLVFLALALWGVEHTERGYKIPLLLWILTNLAVTGFGALALVALNVPADIDPLVERHIEPLSVMGMTRPLWQRPGQGHLQGRVRDIDSGTFTLEDPRGEQWTILLNEHTRIDTPVELEKRLGVLGHPQGEHVIQADVIVPLRRPVPSQLPLGREDGPINRLPSGSGDLGRTGDL